MRVIIDTNLWISFMISDKFRTFEVLIKNQKVVLLFNEELFFEIENTMKKSKLKKYFGSNSFTEMQSAFQGCIEFVDNISNLELCRDPKDNFLLNLSVDGNADFLITGDKDLLVLNQIAKTKIITISDFINSLTKTKTTIK